MTAIRTKKREKILGVMTSAVIVGAMVHITAFKPQLRRYDRLEHNLQQLQLKLIKMRGDLLIKDRIDEIYTSQAPLLRNNGTDQQEISEFTRYLYRLYSRLDMKIKSVKILPVQEDESSRKLMVRLEMTGKISHMVKFISSVAASPEAIRIEQFSLQTEEQVDTVQGSFLISKVVAPLKISREKT
jgi:Tfp pilus assembly protein PilO